MENAQQLPTSIPVEAQINQLPQLETRTTAGSIPIEQNETIPEKKKTGIVRDTPRYLVMAGDIIPPSGKEHHQDFGGSQIGGAYLSPGAVPCLWRTNYFVLRGMITPLIKRTDKPLSSQRNTKTHKEIPQVVTYPYDSMMTATNPTNSRKGLTAIKALEGIEWNAGFIQQFQKHFFPKWELILEDVESLPIELSKFENIIKDGISRGKGNQYVEEIGKHFLQSADRFRKYGLEQIARAKELFAAGANSRGNVMAIANTPRFYAEQLEINLEDSPVQLMNSVANAMQQTSAPESDTNRLLEMMIQNQQQLTAIIAANPGLNIPANMGSVEVVKDEPKAKETQPDTPKEEKPQSIEVVESDDATETTEDTDAIESNPDTAKCDAKKNNGEFCKQDKLQDSRFCGHPAHQLNA